MTRIGGMLNRICVLLVIAVVVSGCATPVPAAPVAARANDAQSRCHKVAVMMMPPGYTSAWPHKPVVTNATD